ncbi:MAG TPA: elongation factor 1-beta [Candidatus Nanoarchaeia archaeon]|nr:elongation factor 1-beta [Candidatus Nanoarchaeia archaeon]
MARMLVTLKIMPVSPDVDLDSLKLKAKEIIKDLGGDVGKEELEPVAFGLKALKLTYIIDESKGIDEVCNSVSSIDGVSSAEAVDMRRTLG